MYLYKNSFAVVRNDYVHSIYIYMSRYEAFVVQLEKCLIDVSSVKHGEMSWA